MQVSHFAEYVIATIFLKQIDALGHLILQKQKKNHLILVNL